MHLTGMLVLQAQAVFCLEAFSVAVNEISIRSATHCGLLTPPWKVGSAPWISSIGVAVCLAWKLFLKSARYDFNTSLTPPVLA